jgi:glycosyltransferase involved in cell wall biosynthesis
MTQTPTVFLFADILGGFGGIETYLEALATRLAADGWDVRVEVSLNAPAPFLTNLAKKGIRVYCQPKVPGDRWQLRQRLLIRHVAKQIRKGDWVFCVRQPMQEIYLSLVRSVHKRGAFVAASWAFSPEFLRPKPGRIGRNFCQAIRETDGVISVSRCTVDQFRTIYGYHGTVKVVSYHNKELFAEPVPLPASPPYNLGYMGRISIEHKNLDTILMAFKALSASRINVFLNIHGDGEDLERLRSLVVREGLSEKVTFHGKYDHLKDLHNIISQNHFFIYASRFEGGPCFALLELLQAGRFVVTSAVGGIPDIYSGRRNIGEMVDATSTSEITAALESAIRRVEANTIDPHAIRRVYTDEFNGELAHKMWLNALTLDKLAPVAPHHQQHSVV